MYHNGRKVWYAVCIGDDVDHGTGSYNKKEAIKIANLYKKEECYKGDRIYIALVDRLNDFTIDIIPIQE